jgi:hypothetical protein
MHLGSSDLDIDYVTVIEPAVESSPAFVVQDGIDINNYLLMVNPARSIYSASHRVRQWKNVDNNLSNRCPH